MIKHYLWSTPNGYKTAIALAEMKLPHEHIWVDITKGEQFSEAFLAISPNNRIPAIADPDGPDGAPITIFESGAILQYLGRKTGLFYGENERERVEIEKWLMWQMGGVGPMFGQAWHFVKSAPKGNDYGIKRYMDESKRLLFVLEKALDGKKYVAGEYSIADMAIFPWVRSFSNLEDGIFETMPNIASWVERNEKREKTAEALLGS